MEYGRCTDCKHFEECYPEPIDTHAWSEDVFIALKAIRQRDLCVNNDKIKWEQI